MAYLAGKWRVALNERILLIFESVKSAGKWRFGGKMNFWRENCVLAEIGIFGEKMTFWRRIGVFGGKKAVWPENGGLGALPLIRAFF